MSITLVGVFDEYVDAEQARHNLEAAGIEKQAIQLTAGDTSMPGAELTESGERPGPIRRFFAELFGSADTDDLTGQYSEAVRRGSAVVSVTDCEETKVAEITRILEECGAIDIEQRLEQWRKGGYSDHDEKAAPYTRDQIDEERSRNVLPVVEEELKVGKRSVQRGGVRVHRRVVDTPVEEQVTLREERAVVDRRPVDRAASQADLQALKDEDIELRETAEEAVVSKTARVVEEVHLGKQASERTETVRDTVRRSDIDVDDLGDVPDRAPARSAADTGTGSYAGPERRIPRTGYSGAERRSGR